MLNKKNNILQSLKIGSLALIFTVLISSSGHSSIAVGTVIAGVGAVTAVVRTGAGLVSLVAGADSKKCKGSCYHTAVCNSLKAKFLAKDKYHESGLESWACDQSGKWIKGSSYPAGKERFQLCVPAESIAEKCDKAAYANDSDTHGQVSFQRQASGGGDDKPYTRSPDKRCTKMNKSNRAKHGC